VKGFLLFCIINFSRYATSAAPNSKLIECEGSERRAVESEEAQKEGRNSTETSLHNPPDKGKDTNKIR
jgi:hypothetical protein